MMTEEFCALVARAYWLAWNECYEATGGHGLSYLHVHQGAAQ